MAKTRTRVRPKKATNKAGPPAEPAEKKLRGEKTSPPAPESSGRQEKGPPSVGGVVPIVGIGASAGGLDAFEKFFSRVPVDSGFAFVVIQHLAPHHASILRDLIAQNTRMPVQEAQNGVVPEANHVYVITPGKKLEIERGVFVLSAAEPGYHPVDGFFCSLAEDQGASAIGIVLSGSGTDGTKGLRAIKEHGGLTFAQRPETAGQE